MWVFNLYHVADGLEVHNRGGLAMIKQQEQEAIDRIRESLEEFPDSRMAQYVTAEDLKTLLKLVEKCVKK